MFVFSDIWGKQTQKNTLRPSRIWLIHAHTDANAHKFKNQNSWAKDTRTHAHAYTFTELFCARVVEKTFYFLAIVNLCLKSLVIFFGVFFCVYVIVFGQTNLRFAVGHNSTNKRVASARAQCTLTSTDMRFIWSICFIQMRYCWQMCCKEKGRFFISFAILATHKHTTTKCFYQWLWNNQPFGWSFFRLSIVCSHSVWEFLFSLFSIANIGVNHLAKNCAILNENDEKKLRATKKIARKSTCSEELCV